MSENQDTQYMVKDTQGSIYGPATIALLRQWIVEHRVLGSMNIAPQGTNDWQLVSSHPQLADLASSPAPTNPAPGITPDLSISAQPIATANPYSAPVQVNYVGLMPASNTSPMAVTSMIAGIISIPFSCLCLPIGGAAGITAVITGFIAMQKMKQNTAIKGHGMAMAGIITGGVGILLSAAVIIFYLFFLMSARAPHRL